MSIPTQSAYIERKAKTTADLLMWLRGEQEARFAMPADFSSSFALSSGLLARAEVWSWQIDAAGVIQLPNLPWAYLR